jgi:hypothetical protein
VRKKIPKYPYKSPKSQGASAPTAPSHGDAHGCCNHVISPFICSTWVFNSRIWTMPTSEWITKILDLITTFVFIQTPFAFVLSHSLCALKSFISIILQNCFSVSLLRNEQLIKKIILSWNINIGANPTKTFTP